MGEVCSKFRLNDVRMSRKKANKIKVKKKKNNALVLCHDRSEYWTTQKQFWQWVRDGLVLKMSDGPLTGKFVRSDEEKVVILANTVLNLAHHNHLNEALSQRRLMTPRKHRSLASL